MLRGKDIWGWKTAVWALGCSSSMDVHVYLPLPLSDSVTPDGSACLCLKSPSLRCRWLPCRLMGCCRDWMNWREWRAYKNTRSIWPLGITIALEIQILGYLIPQWFCGMNFLAEPCLTLQAPLLFQPRRKAAVPSFPLNWLLSLLYTHEDPGEFSAPLTAFQSLLHSALPPSHWLQLQCSHFCSASLFAQRALEVQNYVFPFKLWILSFWHIVGLPWMVVEWIEIHMYTVTL